MDKVLHHLRVILRNRRKRVKSRVSGVLGVIGLSNLVLFVTIPPSTAPIPSVFIKLDRSRNPAPTRILGSTILKHRKGLLRASEESQLSRFYTFSSFCPQRLMGKRGGREAPHPFFSLSLSKRMLGTHGIRPPLSDHMTSFFLFKKCYVHWASHFVMPSKEEQQPGPSGVSREVVIIQVLVGTKS